MQIIQPLTMALVAATSILLGCAETSAIRPAISSSSSFDSAVFQGESVVLGTKTSGSEEFRVFHQGATGFVSVQSVRASAEQRANEFCERRSKVMNPLRETTSKPPHILGNFPRVEIIFECIDKPTAVFTSTGDDPKYIKLVHLKKLLDSGVLSQQEFEREKVKLLN